jgi:hypothetical protein
MMAKKLSIGLIVSRIQIEAVVEPIIVELYKCKSEYKI